MKTSYLAIKKTLASFNRLIIRRQVPHTMVSWRFWAPGRSLAVKMHREVFLRAWQQLPRWAWGLIFLYSHCLWVFFFGWERIIRTWRRCARDAQRQFHISMAQQLLDLLDLSLLHGIPPIFYYTYDLYRQPRQRWFNYVYTHELPHWQTVMSDLPATSAVHRLLSDKQAFAVAMARAGIPAVSTSAFLRRGERVDADTIFTGQSFFLKPNTGSQGQGSFELLYDRATRDYRLVGAEVVAGKDALLSYVQQQVADDDYLVQPLLLNHPEIQRLCRQSRLATVRLITGHDGREPWCIGAVLEIPRSAASKGWWLVQVDCQTGKLLPRCSHGLATFDKATGRPPEVAGKILPCWEEVLEICRCAHAQMPEVAAVGWDVAITPDGAVLLEGNFNWRAAPWQILSGIPLLETRLLQIYASRLWPGSSP
jgi:hypothetical protein